MLHATISVDCGSSLSRAICALDSAYLKPEFIVLKPKVVQVPQEKLDFYEEYKIEKPSIEKSAWIKLGRFSFAVGEFVTDYFSRAQPVSNSLIIDSIIPQTLALVGSFAQKHELSSFSLTLGILLPWNKYQKREKFETQLKNALAKFVFRGQTLSVQLRAFTAMPVGGGLFARGRVALAEEIKLNNAQELNSIVLMLGYHNSSILVVEKGELVKGITEDCGFIRMIEKLEYLSSPQDPLYSLVSVICQVRGHLGEPVLNILAKRNQKNRRKKEIEELLVVIDNARNQYVEVLKNWLERHLPSEIDELIIGGGTAHYLKKELEEILSVFNIKSPINWGDSLEEDLIEDFGDDIRMNFLESRLTDAYGLFHKILLNPRFRLLKGGLGDENKEA